MSLSAIVRLVTHLSSRKDAASEETAQVLDQIAEDASEIGTYWRNQLARMRELQAEIMLSSYRQENEPFLMQNVSEERLTRIVEIFVRENRQSNLPPLYRLRNTIKMFSDDQILRFDGVMKKFSEGTDYKSVIEKPVNSIGRRRGGLYAMFHEVAFEWQETLSDEEVVRKVLEFDYKKAERHVSGIEEQAGKISAAARAYRSRMKS